MQTEFDGFFDNLEKISLPLDDGSAQYYPSWLSKARADHFFSTLLNTLHWRQERIKMFGKWLDIPRLQAWYGEPNCHYSYSGLILDPLPFTAELDQLRKDLEVTIASTFNCVLCNLYRDGQDGMGLHSDDEPELGEQPVIASISLGQPRDFDFKHKSTNERHRVSLSHGSLLVMSDHTQTHYLHGISKRNAALNKRINLTYRLIE